MVNKNCFLLIIISLSIFTQSIFSQHGSKIKFKNITIKTAEKVKSLSDLYAQTGDRQVEIVLKELKFILPKVKNFWKEIKKRKVVNGIYIEDSVEFVKFIALEKSFGLRWHQKNFKIVEEARKIFKEHPLLKRIAIAQDGIIVMLEKNKRGLILSYDIDYIENYDKPSEIQSIEKDGISIENKEGFYFYFSSSYEPDILELAEGHIFFILDENDLIIEMTGFKREQANLE